MPDQDRHLPYARPCVDDDDIAAVVAVLRSDWLTTGPVVERFERKLAEKVGARYAVACSSGTSALHMAVHALNLGRDDAAVVPAITFLATANVVRFVGAEVIFADVDPATGLMGEKELVEALERYQGKARPRVVLPVHLAGQCTDMEALAGAADRLGLKVVEDACHAIGTTYRGAGGRSFTMGACGHSDLCTFSFHAVKTVTMGEGGAVTTNDAGLRERLVRYRNHGMDRNAASFEYPELALDENGERNPWYYEMPQLGANYRATDIQCALGLSQLGKLDRFVEKRSALVSKYDELLASLSPLVQPLRRMPECVAAWHLYVVLIDFGAAGISRAAVTKRLNAQGIGSQVHYVPVPWQPYYRRRLGAQRFDGAESYYGKALSLPLFPRMDEGDVERVVQVLRNALGVEASRLSPAVTFAQTAKGG
jgi:UDP-4-amino-4,6-dideoxy-N-acetyl-beta-L-altrosamine transaminase